MANRENRRTGSVGVTFAKARVANPLAAELPSVELELLIDTGAI